MAQYEDKKMEIIDSLAIWTTTYVGHWPTLALIVLLLQGAYLSLLLWNDLQSFRHLCYSDYLGRRALWVLRYRETASAVWLAVVLATAYRYNLTASALSGVVVIAVAVLVAFCIDFVLEAHDKRTWKKIKKELDT